MSEGNVDTGWSGVHRVPCFWTGLAFALGGYLAEEFTGDEHGFEAFILFGGLFLGIAFERNRQSEK